MKVAINGRTFDEAMRGRFKDENPAAVICGFSSSVIYHEDGSWEEHEHEPRLTSDLHRGTVEGTYRIRLRRRGRWARPPAEAT